MVLSENFQKVFSINKGSIPVRIDMLKDMGKYGFDMGKSSTGKKDYRNMPCGWRSR